MARTRKVGMPFTIEMLMTIAASGALVTEKPEGRVVVFLFAVGELLEGASAGEGQRNSIRALEPSWCRQRRGLKLDSKTR